MIIYMGKLPFQTPTIKEYRQFHVHYKGKIAVPVLSQQWMKCQAFFHMLTFQVRYYKRLDYDYTWVVTLFLTLI